MKTTLIVILLLGCCLLMDAQAGHHGGRRGHHGAGGMRGPRRGGRRRGHHKLGIPAAILGAMRKCRNDCHDDCGSTTLKTCSIACIKTACPQGATQATCRETKMNCMGNCYSSGNVTLDCGRCVASCDNVINQCRKNRCSADCDADTVQGLHALPACNDCMRTKCGPRFGKLGNAGDQGGEEGGEEAGEDVADP